jgi:hypothetical protein
MDEITKGNEIKDDKGTSTILNDFSTAFIKVVNNIAQASVNVANDVAKSFSGGRDNDKWNIN